MLPQPMMPMPTRFMLPRVLMHSEIARRAPGRSCSTARRRAPQRSAAAPRAQRVVRIVDRDLGDVGEPSAAAPGRARCGGWPMQVLAEHQRRPDEDHPRRREERDEVGDGEAQRLAGAHRRGGQRVVAGRDALARELHRMAEADRLAELRLVGERARIAGSAAGRRAATWPSRRCRRRHDQVAEVEADPLGAAEELATVHDAEPERVLDRHHDEIVEVAAAAEPVLGDGDRVGVALDQRREAEPLEQRLAEGHVASRAGSGSAARARSHTRRRPGSADAEALDRDPASARRRRRSGARRPRRDRRSRPPAAGRPGPAAISSASTSPWKSVTTCTMRSA